MHFRKRCYSRPVFFLHIKVIILSAKGAAAVTVHQTKSLEQTKKSMAEQLWLNYYNQTLFENGLITEAERNRMKNMINALMPPAAK